ncbi:MAG: zinc metallopeptidase [Bacilli bacterium]|nr:zinc metallopeptidase [Bacilli bacterium]
MEILIYYGLPIIGTIIVLFAQFSISSNYKKYSGIKNNKNISGSEIARIILDKNGLNNIYVVETSGELTDHYDPSRKVVRLSKNIYRGTSIASISVAAHEVGHAIQDKEGYSFMRIRSFLVPIVNLTTYLGYFGLIISIFAGITGYLKVSIIILLASLLFQLVTLPVEFDASKRAKKQLNELGVVNSDEANGVKIMLFAAALTYVASFLSNILQLLRLVLMLGGRDD